MQTGSTADVTRGPAARLQDELAKQLVLQAGLGDGEVDDGDTRAQLGREVRVGQPRGAEQAERLRVVHLPPAQQQVVGSVKDGLMPIVPACVWEQWFLALLFTGHMQACRGGQSMHDAQGSRVSARDF